LPLHDGTVAEYRLVDMLDLPHELRSHINCFEQYTCAIRDRERFDRHSHQPLAYAVLRRFKRRLSTLKRVFGSRSA
jgi:hypothetical protein